MPCLRQHINCKGPRQVLVVVLVVTGFRCSAHTMNASHHTIATSTRHHREHPFEVGKGMGNWP